MSAFLDENGKLVAVSKSNPLPVETTQSTTTETVGNSTITSGVFTYTLALSNFFRDQ